MMHKFKFLKQYWLQFFVGLFLPGTSFAGPSIGDMAENIFAPTEVLTKLVLVACYIIGAMLIFASMAQYKIHRQSPKLVPLTTPVLLLILGIICVLIPYSSKLFGESYSAVEQAEEKGMHKKENVLPLPDVTKKGLMLPTPPAPAGGDDSSYSSPSSATPNDSSGGGYQNEAPRHWTEDPRYN